MTTLAGFRNTVDIVVDLDKPCTFLSKLKKILSPIYVAKKISKF